MKHHFAPWSWEAPTSGLAALAIQPGDAHSHCTRCKVKVKIAQGQATTKFWVGGRWVAKKPPCEAQ